jgi:hypothetical protein
VEDASRFRQRDPLEAALVEEVPQVGCEAFVGSLDRVVAPAAEMVEEPRGHDRKHAFGGQRFTGIGKGLVEGMDPLNDRRVLDVRIIHSWPDHPLVQYAGRQVDHPLPVPQAMGGSSIVHEVRRQDRHPSSSSAAMPTFDVVPDRAIVDDEDGPGVVRVGRVRVIHEPGVEDLVDTGDRRLPGANPIGA